MEGTSPAFPLSPSSSPSSSGHEALEVMSVVASGEASLRPSPSSERFEWVRPEVLSYGSKIPREEVISLAESGLWVSESATHKFVMSRCHSRERVCHSADEGERDFIYMYESVLTDLGVTLPFDSCTGNVLRSLGIAPSQLHPNGWAALQAFRMLCRGIGLIPSAQIFLNNHTVRVGKSVG